MYFSRVSYVYAITGLRSITWSQVVRSKVSDYNGQLEHCFYCYTNE